MLNNVALPLIFATVSAGRGDYLRWHANCQKALTNHQRRSVFSSPRSRR
jgi:hypothetical protein